MSFEFDLEGQFYRLSGKVYDAIDLICFTNGVFRYMNSINKRGYIREKALEGTFMIHITNHLFSLGSKNKNKL